MWIYRTEVLRSSCQTVRNDTGVCRDGDVRKRLSANGSLKLTRHTHNRDASQQRERHRNHHQKAVILRGLVLQLVLFIVGLGGIFTLTSTQHKGPSNANISMMDLHASLRHYPLFITHAAASKVTARRRPLSSPYAKFTPLPENVPFGYTIASNASFSEPIDGFVGRGAAFGDNVAVWRNPTTDTLTFVDQSFFIVRQLLPKDGPGRVNTIAGVVSDYGSNDGPRLTSRFNAPSSIVGYKNQFIIADRDNNCLRKMSMVGPVFSNVATFAGTCGGISSGPNSFFRPTSVDATDDYVYVADQLNNAIKRVDANGAATVVATRNDWGPQYVAVIDDATSFVVSSDLELFVVDMTSGLIRSTNFKTSARTVANVQPTVHRLTGTLYFVAQQLNTQLSQTIFSYNLASNTFTSFYTYDYGSGDGLNPTFREVTALHIISEYELLVIQKLSIRGVFIKTTPNATATASQTLSVSMTLSGTNQNSATRSTKVTASQSASKTLWPYMYLPVYFLSLGFPLSNTTAMSIAKELMIDDLDACLLPIDESVVSATNLTVAPPRPDLMIFSNLTLYRTLPMPRGEDLIRNCSMPRLKAFLADNYNETLCIVNASDAQAGRVSEDYCAVSPPPTTTTEPPTNTSTTTTITTTTTAATTTTTEATTATNTTTMTTTTTPLPTPSATDEVSRDFTCETRCKVAAVVSSVGFTAVVAAVVILGMTASTSSTIVSALLLMPGGGF